MEKIIIYKLLFVEINWRFLPKIKIKNRVDLFYYYVVFKINLLAQQYKLYDNLSILITWVN